MIIADQPLFSQPFCLGFYFLYYRFFGLFTEFQIALQFKIFHFVDNSAQLDARSGHKGAVPRFGAAFGHLILWYWMLGHGFVR
jgi:hypothetical protein